MTLLGHPKTAPEDSPTIPFSSLTRSRWTVVRRTESRPMRQPERPRWTCAGCGAVLDGIVAAAGHIDLHRAQDGKDG
jgi:hypothetical protein